MSEPKKVNKVSQSEQTSSVSESVSTSDKIWEEIKDKKLELFSLPNETVQMYCKQATVEPSKLYLTTKTNALLPALDNAIGDKYKVEVQHNFLVVSYK